MIFNFNQQNRKDFAEIFFGKGLFFSITSTFLMIIFIIGFLVMPWKMNLQELTFRTFVLLFISLIIFQYYRAIIKMSFDENNLYVKIWKKEMVYAINDINQIKTTYFAAWGIVLISIKGKHKNKFYILWAPSFDKDRYNLFLNMKDYIEKRVVRQQKGIRE